MSRRTEGNGRSSKKNLQREQLILAMLQQPNWEKAAASVGISLSTAYRIRKTPEFQAEYLQARRDAVSQAVARLQQACAAAASVMLQAMTDRSNPAACRARIADRVIVHAEKSLESEDLEMRLQSVEQKIAEIVGLKSI
jgi:hypothetical protein